MINVEGCVYCGLMKLGWRIDIHKSNLISLQGPVDDINKRYKLSCDREWWGLWLTGGHMPISKGSFHTVPVV